MMFHRLQPLLKFMFASRLHAPRFEAILLAASMEPQEPLLDAELGLGVQVMFQSCDLLFHHVLNIFLNPKLY
jgi:hypothetical protein